MDDIQELYYLFPDIKEHIRVVKKVGQGTFSYVYLGHFIENEEDKLALKYIIPTSSPSRTKQEIDCLLNIGGQDNVIGVFSVLRNKSHILILMPYVHHVSFHDSFVKWNLEEVRDYIKNLLIALNRVHKCGIIHRDVKPSNFLYDQKKKIFALVDFGLAQSYDAEEEFDIFNEKFVPNKKRLSNIQNENQPKHNMINIRSAAASTSSSKSSAVNPLANKLTSSNNKNSPYGFLSKMPNNKLINNFLNDESIKSPLNNSRSFDCNLNLNAESPPTTPTLNLTNNDNDRSSPLLSMNKQTSQSCLISVPRKSTTKTYTTSSSGILAITTIKTNTITTTKTTETPLASMVTTTSIKKESGLSINLKAEDQLIKSNNLTPNANPSAVKAIPTAKSSTPNLQKYYSFQKPSFNFSDNRCNCYNMPFVCEMCTTRNSKWAPRAGTAGFRAPEVLFRSNHQTPAVDIWSAGIIFLSLLTGRYPFFKALDDNMAIMQLISLFGYESMRKAANKYGDSIICSYEKKPTELREICKKLRKHSLKASNRGNEASKKRESVESNQMNISIPNMVPENESSETNDDAKFNEFPDSAYDLLKSLLELDCDKRISADEALNHPFFTTIDNSLDNSMKVDQN